MRAKTILTAIFLLLLPALAGAQYRTLNDRLAPPAFTSRADWDARAA